MEMKNSIIFITTLITIVMTCGAEKDSGYIFTCPRTLNIGSINQLQLIRFGNLDAGTIKVKLYYQVGSYGNLTLASENEYKLRQGRKKKFINLFVAPFNENDVYHGTIEISGNIGDDTINGSDDVQFSSPKNNIIIIQTDKPFYKPGQNAKVRFLKVDKNLKPSLKKSDLGDVYVTDPNGIRLFQFDKIPLGKGLHELQFQLDDETTLGQWTIHLNTENDTETTTFDVKQYELPKFEVKMHFPSFVLSSEKFIPIQVCANYTYGKPVMGQLNLNMSLQHYDYKYYDDYDNLVDYDFSPSSSPRQYPVVQVSVKLEGCYNYILNISEIQTDDYEYQRSIVIVANVIEDGTGVQVNDTENIDRTTQPLVLNFNTDLNYEQYFKPGLPYTGKLKVTNPDGTPAGGEPISLCYTVSKQIVLANWLSKRQVQYCKNFTSNDNGIIRYTIPPQNADTTSINLEAKSIKYASDPQNILDQPQTNQNLNPFYSPSGSFIQLENLGQVLSCNTHQDVRLLFTSKGKADFKFYYEVIRQGKVVQSGTKEVAFKAEDDVSGKFQNDNRLINDSEKQLVPPPKSSSSPSFSSSSSCSCESSEYDCPAAEESKYIPLIGQVKIEIDVNYNLSPGFTLLVFYVREDRETVADSEKFAVEQCFKNEVDFEFSRAVLQPGLNTTVTIKASPYSLCGWRAVDKSVTLLDNSNQLTKDTVFDIIQNMDTGNYYSSNPCYDDTPQPGLSVSSVIIPPPGIYSADSYEDSYASFLESGFLVISNLFVITRPCPNKPGGDFGGVGFLPPVLPLPFPGPVLAEAGIARLPTPSAPGRPADDGDDKIPFPTQSVADVRTKFPETWLFGLEMLGATGEYTSKEVLPDTITEWLGNAVCVSPKDGLGISNTATIDGFQLFFIDFTLPINAIRGEEFIIVVSIFSYIDDGALPITVSLEQPQGYQIVNSSIDGDICLQQGTSQNFRLHLKATTVGNINITVRAETAHSSDVCAGSVTSNAVARDAITKSLNVEAEGFPENEVQSDIICPSNNNNYYGTYKLPTPPGVVKDTERVVVDLTGDILGPGIPDLDYLLEIPIGSGEENLVAFTPNYLALDFLSSIGQLADRLKTTAIHNLNTGYERELSFRHADGSFSGLTTDNSGSMFLTAFALRSFYQAKQYITIDDNVLADAQTWITTRQEEDGCFSNIGNIVDSEIQGGLENDKSPNAITAYVLASLLISQYGNQTVINSAKKCLNNNSPSNAYETFIVAYVEALAGDEDAANKLVNDIKPFIRRNDSVEYYYIDNSTQELNLEIVSYAILTNLLLGQSTVDVLPLVRYVTQKLDITGALDATQDTCIGVEAITKFAKLIYRNPVDMEIDIGTNIYGGYSGTDLEETTEITQDNKFLVQRKILSKVPSTLFLTARGSGCALIEITTSYNLIKPPEKHIFFISVIGECLSADCKQRKISGSVSYGTYMETAGLSVVQIKMVTGTVPDKNSLLELPNPKQNKIIKTEVEDNTVNIYFSEIPSSEGESFEFQVNEVIEVKHPKPGTAKVFEYYVPENSATTTYTFGNSLSSGTSPASGNSESYGSSPASGNSESYGSSPASGNSESSVPPSKLHDDTEYYGTSSDVY